MCVGTCEQCLTQLMSRPGFKDFRVAADMGTTVFSCVVCKLTGECLLLRVRSTVVGLRIFFVTLGALAESSVLSSEEEDSSVYSSLASPSYLFCMLFSLFLSFCDESSDESPCVFFFLKRPALRHIIVSA